MGKKGEEKWSGRTISCGCTLMLHYRKREIDVDGMVPANFFFSVALLFLQWHAKSVGR